MHIKFDSIYLKRFRSFLDEATLHFDSAGVGLYFLKGKNEAQSALGSNGSGKSTCLDALSWCLYGKTIQGLKNTDIAPWTGKGQTIVEVTIQIDNEVHKIKRTANPNLLSIDGSEAAQSYVDKLIGIPIEIMPYAIIMGQRQPLFFDLTPSEKLRVFTEPLNLERWEQRSVRASELVKELEIKQEALLLEIELQKGQLTKAEAAHRLWKEKAAEWEQERADALKHRDKDRSSMQTMLTSIQSQYDNADLTLERAETELRAISLEKLQKENYKLQKEYREAETKYQTLSLEQQSLLKTSEKVDKGICPTCKQPLKTHKKALQADLDRRAKEVAEELKAAVEAFKRVSAASEEIEARVESEIEAKQKFQVESNQARDDLLRLGRQKSEFEAQIKSLDERIKEYEAQNNPFKDEVQAARRNFMQINDAIDKATERGVPLREQCERTRYWVKGFKEIKLYTLTEILQELQLTTNSLLQEFGLVDWQIHYDVERETKAKTIARGLNITVLSGNNKEAVKWEVWSGGEAQRLRLIGSIALGSVLLNHLGVSTNLMVFDEPTESLSKEGVVDLVELLANHAKDAQKNVILVDHHAIESSHFVDVITVTKDKQGSRLQ